ncbi:MAG: hypothetical protein ACYSU7_06900 [Planctomycetota bacterium]|jgi:hypothetical protein
MPADAQQVADQAYAAAESEADSRGWGTSQEDITAYATAAGAVAGAGACAAVGAAAAAPLCAYVAGEVVGWLTDTIGGWFYSDEEAEAARKRRAEVREHFRTMRVAVELDRENAREFNRMLDQLNALHAELWPGSRWEGLDPRHPQAEWQRAMLLLQLSGAPMVESFGDHTLLGLESVRDLWAELDSRGIGDAQKESWVTDRAEQIGGQLERAFNDAVLQLTTQKAAELAVGEAQAQADPGAAPSGKVSTMARFAARYQARAAEREQETYQQTRPGHRWIPRSDRSWLKAATAIVPTLAVAAAVVWDARRKAGYLRRGV